jgi:hypothetical protein
MEQRKKKRRGRPPAGDQMKKLTAVFATTITSKSGLKAAELELIFNIKSTPPGNNWSRYMRGDRSMAPEVRERIGKIAVKKGWLRTTGVMTEDDAKAYAWIGKQSLESIRTQAKSKRQQLKLVKKTIAETSAQLQSLVQTLKAYGFDSAEKLWRVENDDYAELRESKDESFGEFEQYILRLCHQHEFIDEVCALIEKLNSITFDFAEMEIDRVNIG